MSSLIGLLRGVNEFELIGVPNKLKITKFDCTTNHKIFCLISFVNDPNKFKGNKVLVFMTESVSNNWLEDLILSYEATSFILPN